MALVNAGGFEFGMPGTIGDPAGQAKGSGGTLARGSIDTAIVIASGTRTFRTEDLAGNFQGCQLSLGTPTCQDLGIDSGTTSTDFVGAFYIDAFGVNQTALWDFGGNSVQLVPGSSGIRLSGASDSAVITLSEDTAYWAVVKIIGGTDACTLSVFSVATGAQVGSTVTNTSHGGTVNSVTPGIQAGCYQNDVRFGPWAIASGGAVGFFPHAWRLGPDGAGNSTSWTGAYTDVDEIAQDNDTTHLATSSAGAKEDVTLESTAPGSVVGAVKAVVTLAVVRDEGGASSIETYVRIAGTDYEQNENVDPGAATAYLGIGKLLATSPATSSAWTASELDGTNVGVLNNNAVAVRCTTLAVMVITDGVSAPAAATPADDADWLSSALEERPPGDDTAIFESLHDDLWPPVGGDTLRAVDASADELMAAVVLMDEAVRHAAAAAEGALFESLQDDLWPPVGGDTLLAIDGTADEVTATAVLMDEALREAWQATEVALFAALHEVLPVDGGLVVLPDLPVDDLDWMAVALELPPLPHSTADEQLLPISALALTPAAASGAATTSAVLVVAGITLDQSQEELTTALDAAALDDGHALAIAIASTEVLPVDGGPVVFPDLPAEDLDWLAAVLETLPPPDTTSDEQLLPLSGRPLAPSLASGAATASAILAAAGITLDRAHELQSAFDLALLDDGRTIEIVNLLHHEVIPVDGTVIITVVSAVATAVLDGFGRSVAVLDGELAAASTLDGAYVATAQLESD